MNLPLATPQYLFDDAWIAHQQRLVRRWLPAMVYPNPVIVPDRPWEAQMVALYGTVLPEPSGGCRMYYSDFGTPTPCKSKVMLACSTDGLHWEKPNLGTTEWRGSRENNIVLASEMPTDSPSVIHEPGDTESAYKLLAFHTPQWEPRWESWGLFAYTSRDGISWTPVPGRRVKAGDRTNLMATRPGGRYVAYTRHPDMGAQHGCRCVYRIESADFITWSEPEFVLAPDLNDEPDVEYYGMSVFERHGWFLGLLEYWRSNVDVIETHVAFSRDGRSWTVPVPRRPFIAATCDWNRTWSTCASNGPIIIGEQMVFYFGGRLTSHHFDSAQQYGAIGYASLPVDRFCAFEAAAGGRLVTVPFEWPGGELALNADTRGVYTSHPFHLNGRIRVEVHDAQGKPITGYSGDRAASFAGNTHCRGQIHDQIVHWPGDSRLNDLRGRTVRLCFDLVQARLFTFEAGKTADAS